MNNKYLRSKEVEINKNRLDKISKTLQTSINSSSFYTMEQYLEEATKILTKYYKDIDAPIIETEHVPRLGDQPKYDLYNDLFSILQDNLSILFSEFENVEDFILSNFNYAVTNSERLTARLKRISSLVGDYLLYSNVSAGSILCRDSFNNFDKIDINSSLLNNPQCNINEGEGIVTLPIDLSKDSSVQVYLTPLINPNSNGASGNNYEIGSDFHGDISLLLDNNPDTWFEYERVTRATEDTGEPLVLDLNLQLSSTRVINHIRINPNNFGTRTSIKIETIETSIDGKTYINVKDDIPITDYITEDEENIFLLAPSTSKYAGQGFYTFVPRKAKYVHVVLSQSEPYIINTTTGEQLRYAIGLRDIEIRAYVFQSSGEFISKAYTSTNEISKVSIRSSQNPLIDSSLAAIKHFISPDDGVTWLPIQPQQITGTTGKVNTIPEILNFNNAGDNSLTTLRPVGSVRYKALLERYDAAFTSDSTALYSTISTASELHSVPSNSPHTFKLAAKPLLDTIHIVDPLYGSRGLSKYAYDVGMGGDRIYNMPEWENIENVRPWKKVLTDGIYSTILSDDSDWLHLYVGNQRWTIATSNFAQYNADDKVYKIDWNSSPAKLSFGDGYGGSTPLDSEKISLYFNAERVFPINGENTIFKFLFPTAADKNMITIKRYGELRSGSTLVPKGATVVRLRHQNISSLLTDLSGVADIKTFINGQDEFNATGQYSLDYERGILYVSDPYCLQYINAISYQYQVVTTLTTDDFEWGNDSSYHDSVKIKSSGWETINFNYDLTLSSLFTSTTHTLHLPYQSILKKNLRITSTVDATIHNSFVEEVPYVDGITELDSLVLVEQDIGSLVYSGELISFTLDEIIATDTQDDIILSDNTYFQTLQVDEEACTSTGDYCIINYSGAVTISLFWEENITDAGKAIYYKVGRRADTGLYSVDYAKGIIYTQRAIDSDYITDVSIEGEYTDYRAEYPIARLVNPKNYSADYFTGEVKFINTEELFIKQSVSRQSEVKYQVSYDYVSQSRQDIGEIKDYFSPVLKDYAIKIQPKDF